MKSKMSFKIEHGNWFQYHLSRRTGERRDRLKRGHSHAERLFLERVWWPLFGHFNHLHPEYEVLDWRGQRYYIDLLLRIGLIFIAFEIKGYGFHVERADRTQYKRELVRELFFDSIGIRVVSIPYDELESNPALIRSLVNMVVSQYAGEDFYKGEHLSRIEREIIRLALRSERVVRPFEAAKALEINHRTVVKYLQRMCEKGLFRSVASGNSGRVTRYEYIGSLLNSPGLLQSGKQ